MTLIETLQLLVVFTIGLAAGRFGTLVQASYLNKAGEKLREKKQSQDAKQTIKPLIEIK